MFFVVEVDNEGFKVLDSNGVEIDPSTEATLEAARVLLASIDAKDFATETKLEQVRTLLASIDGKDFATETTLATKASEATAAASDAKLATIDSVLDSIKDTDGIKKITDALPVGDNVLGKSKIVNDAEDKVVDIITDTAESIERLAISGKVSVSAPPPPTGGVSVVIAADDPLTVGSDDTDYIITTGKTFRIQQIVAGAAGDPNEKGSRIEIIFDNGTEHLIERIYISGFTEFGSYPDTSETRDGLSLVGNGTNKIVVRREKISGSNREIDAVVRGYEI